MTTKTEHAATRDVKTAVASILRRAGYNPDLADQIHNAYTGRHWTPPKATETTIQRCANPIDPHTGTALVGGRCPICGWTPGEDN